MASMAEMQIPRPWTDFDGTQCSMFRTLDVLRDRWSLLVLREVFNGVRRFDEIQDHLEISRSVLTDRLATLVSSGFLERRPYQEEGTRVRHEYVLSEMGRDLRPVFIALTQFGDRWLVDPEGPPAILAHRDCGAAVGVRMVCEHDHEITRGRELVFVPGPSARLRAS
jgi:DNA-binding HxlR family transcriptional regulator